MAYDLEEQEQLAAIKAWWAQYGKLVIVTVIAGLLVVGGLHKRLTTTAVLGNHLTVVLQQGAVGYVSEVAT